MENQRKRNQSVVVKCRKCGKNFNIRHARAQNIGAEAVMRTLCNECQQASKQPKKKKPRTLDQQQPMVLTSVHANINKEKKKKTGSLLSKKMRAAKTGTIIPMRTNLTATRNFLIQMLNPKASAGARGIKMKADNVQFPRTAYNFNSVFMVTGELVTDFKIRFFASPIVIAQIYSPNIDQLNIVGATAFRSGNYYYVLGSKTEQLGELDNRYFFTPRADWYKYRCVGYSASSSWVGREIDKAGMCYAARMNEEVPLEQFDATQKQDSVYSKAFCDLSFAATHKEPVYNWLYAEPTEAIIDKPDENFTDVTIAIGTSSESSGPFDRSGLILTTVPGAGMNTLAAAWNNVTQGFVFNTPADVPTFVARQLDQQNRRWNFITTNSDGTVNMDVTFEFEVAGAIANVWQPPVSATRQTNFTQPNLRSLAIALLNEIGNELTANTGGPFTRAIPNNTFMDAKCLIRLKVRSTGLVQRSYNRSVTVTRSIPSLLSVHELDGMFADQTFAEPVAQYLIPQVGATANTAFQFIHNTNYELAVSDTSILNNFTVAESGDKNEDIIDMQNDTIQHIMQCLPPVLTYDAGQLASTAQTELASRGIIMDIYNTLGPLAAMVFPEASPYIAMGGQLATAIDSLNLF